MSDEEKKLYLMVSIGIILIIVFALLVFGRG